MKLVSNTALSTCDGTTKREGRLSKGLLASRYRPSISPPWSVVTQTYSPPVRPSNGLLLRGAEFRWTFSTPIKWSTRMMLPPLPVNAYNLLSLRRQRHVRPFLGPFPLSVSSLSLSHSHTHMRLPMPLPMPSIARAQTAKTCNGPTDQPSEIRPTNQPNDHPSLVPRAFH